MKVVYQGKDIYPDISVGRCFHDMHAWGAMDSLDIDFGDTRDLWDGWGPKEGDTIEVEDGAARTGKMFVSSVIPQSSRFSIRAYPAPQSFRERRCKSWERVRLMQLVREVAGNAGLTVESYGIEDVEYAYVEQDNVSDMSFLDRRLTLEGASMVVFDGKLVVYSGAWLESQGANGEISVDPGSDYEFRDESARAYGSCTVTDGRTTSSFSAGDGKELRAVLKERITDAAEGARFARGLLRKANRESVRMTVRTDSMLRGYAAGSLTTLRASAAASWDGEAVVYAKRNDYYDAKSKVWLARPLGGY